MVAGCGGNCMKYTLFFFNAIFFLAGLGLVGIGATLMATWDTFAGQIDTGDLEIDMNKAATITAIVFMVAGFILMGICFFGCCGAVKEIKCLLATYAVLVGIIIIGELAIVITLFVYRNQLDGLRELANESLRDKVRRYTEQDHLSGNLDVLQQKFECCGADSYMDYRNAKDWEQIKYYQVPISCCKLMDKNGAFDTSNLLYDNCPEVPTALNSYIMQPCVSKTAWPEVINLIFIIVVATGFGFMALELIGLIFAICLIRMISEPRAVPV